MPSQAKTADIANQPEDEFTHVYVSKQTRARINQFTQYTQDEAVAAALDLLESVDEV